MVFYAGLNKGSVYVYQALVQFHQDMAQRKWKGAVKIKSMVESGR